MCSPSFERSHQINHSSPHHIIHHLNTPKPNSTSSTKMQFSTVIVSLFGSLAVASPLIQERASVCSSALDTPQCCQVGVDGVVELTCESRMLAYVIPHMNNKLIIFVCSFLRTNITLQLPEHLRCWWFRCQVLRLATCW